MNTQVRVDPQAHTVLDGIADQVAKAPKPDRPPSERERVAMTRQGYAATTALAGPVEPVHAVAGTMVSSPAGPIPVRVYLPVAATTAAPALIWFHGGSFVAGDLDTHDIPLRALANRLGFPIISVAWRLAPEHPYPAGIHDAYAALCWAAQRAIPGATIDPSRLAVGGGSAGGAIAAVLTQISHARGGPSIAFQVLIYPNTDLTDGGRQFPSWVDNDGCVLTRSDMEVNFALYAGAVDRADPGLSPLHAIDLKGLPPAFVATGEADPQRDEGEAYVERLRRAGNAVEHVRYPGMIHGFFQMGGVIDAGHD